MYDVYLYGMISASTVYVMDDTFVFPQPNQYGEIRQSYASVGGEAVNSAIMLSKLGLKTKLDGNWLNKDNADKILNLLKPFDIDSSRVTIKPNCGTEEFVITDRNSRTVFGNYANFHSGKKQWNGSQEEDIQNASIIGLDPYFKGDALMTAQLCVQNKKPYVTLDCRYDDFIARNAAVLIISHELRDQAYPEGSMIDLFNKYQTSCNGLIIFTFGSEELWYGRKGQRVNKYTPYKITPLDTTGAGDSFRAGIIYGILKSWDDKATIEFASAVAACVCLTIPHTLHAPELDGVLAFMKNNNR